MSSNKILPEEIVNIIENEGFSCNGKISKQSGEYYVEIFQGTPLGEDWNETIWFDGSKESFIEAVRNRANIFDVDKEVEIWIPCRGENGCPSSIEALVEDMKHDYIIYQMHERKLMSRYNKNKELIVNKVNEMIPNINLTGQWSLDIMQNGDDFWLIDMATADCSALNDCIPKEKLNKVPENWIPDFERLKSN